MSELKGNQYETIRERHGIAAVDCRSRIATYTVTVVMAACFASAVLGGVLKTTHGDFLWITITHASSGGLTQLGKIEVRSAGGRNSCVTMRGKNPDLQRVEPNTANMYGYSYGAEPARSGCPSFSWQPNTLPAEVDTYQINIPITPWGRRQLYASAFDLDARGLEYELKYEAPVSSAESQTASSESSLESLGKFTLTATNHLPFDLTDCRLVIGRTDVVANDGGSGFAYDPRSGHPIRRKNVDSSGDLVQFVTTANIGELRMSKTVTTDTTIVKEASPSNDVWMLPRIAFKGATGVWIVGHISRSSVLSIDERRSDFELTQEQHYFLQEIPPEEMPVEWLRDQQRYLERQLKSAPSLEKSESR